MLRQTVVVRRSGPGSALMLACAGVAAFVAGGRSARAVSGNFSFSPHTVAADGASWANAFNWQPENVPNETVGGDVANASIVGGFQTFANGNFAIHSLQLGVADSVQIGTNNSLRLRANSDVSGTIKLNDFDGNGGNFADLVIDGAVTLNGSSGQTGTVSFVTNLQNRVVAGAVGSVLTLGPLERILAQGQFTNGQVSVNLVNNGLVFADSGTITLDMAAMTNAGTVRVAGNTGRVFLNGTNVNNAGGTFDVGAGANLNATGVTVSGGSLVGPGNLNVGGTLTLNAGGAGMMSEVTINTPTNATVLLSGNLQNNGAIRLSDTDGNGGNFATLVVSGAATLSGAGQVLFTTGLQNVIDRANVSDSLTVGSQQTVGTLAGGNGEIRTALVNNGTVDAAAGTISLTGDPKTNNAVMRARNAGVLALSGIVLTQGAGAGVTADATSRLSLSTSAIVGQTVNVAGTLDLAGSHLSGTTLTTAGATNVNAGITTVTGTYTNAAAGVVNVATNGELRFRAGSTYVNQGTIRLNDTDGNGGNLAILRIDGNVTADGTPGAAGKLLLQSGQQNYIVGTSPTDTLTVGPNQSIATAGAGSAGVITTNLVNNGAVNVPGGTITLSSTRVANNAAITVGTGGNLVVDNSTITNTPTSSVAVAAGGTVSMVNSVLTGGTLAGPGAVNLAGTNTFDGSVVGGLAFANGVTLNVPTNAVAVLRGAVANAGNVILADTDGNGGNFATLTIDGNVTLSGAGAITFGSPQQNRIDRTNFGDLLTLSAGQTIATTGGAGRSGTILARLVNNGTVDAEAGTVALTAEDKTNNATMRSRNGGTLAISGITLANAGGTISADATSSLSLSSAAITGGAVNVAGGMSLSTANLLAVALEHSGNSTVNAGVTAITGTAHNAPTGTFTVYTNGELKLVAGSAYVNDGNIRLNDTDGNGGNFAVLRIDGSLTLDAAPGSAGKVTFASAQQNFILPVNAGDTLTVGARQLVGTAAGGAGAINTYLVNLGTVDANGGSVTINSPTVANSGLLRATLGGTLTVNSSTITNVAPAGTITVSAGSALNINASTIVGGTLDGGGAVNVGGGSLYLDGTAPNGITLAGMTVNVATNQTLNLRGAVRNDSTIRLADTDGNGGNFATLSLAADTTLSGAGSVVFATGLQNVIDRQLFGATLTLGANQAITTAGGAGRNGEVRARLANLGLVDADAGTITLTGEAKTNASLMRAVNGGTLAVSGTSVTNAPSAQITTDATSAFNIFSGAVSGGTVDVGNASTFATATINADLTNRGPSTVAPGVTTLTGSYRNTPTGTVTVQTNGELRLRGNSTYVNEGTITLADTDGNGGNLAVLRVDGNVALNGTPGSPGTLRFGTGLQNVIAPVLAGNTLTLGALQTLSAGPSTAGTVTANLVNDGQVQAPGGSILFSGMLLTNHTAASATAGGTLNFSSASVANAGGTLSAAAGTAINLTNTSVAGGTVSGAGTVNVGGTVNLDGATAGTLTLSGVTTNVGTNANLSIRGAVTNDATIRLNDTDGNGGNFATLRTDGNTTLAGNGQVQFVSGQQNVIDRAAVGDVLTLGSKQTVTTLASAAGRITVALLNQGTVDAAAGGTITLDGEPKTNAGMFRASGGGTLNHAALSTNFSAGRLTGGAWWVTGNSTMRLQGMKIVHNDATIVIDGAASNLYRDNGTTGALSDLALNSGSLTLNNGKALTTPADFTNTGSLQVVTPADRFTAAGKFTWTGGLVTNSTILGNGVVVAGNGMNVSGSVLRSSAGLTVVTGALTLAPGARMDLDKSDLIVNYPSAGPSPAAGILDLLRTGSAKGAWNGPGINTRAANDAAKATTLGYADNVDLHYATFHDEPVDDSSVLVKYTWYGDADLDGDVDQADAARASAGFNAHLAGWVNGDFNLDGTVSPDDFALLAWGAASQTGVLGAAIPEPGGAIAMLVLTTICVGSRRRRA